MRRKAPLLPVAGAILLGTLWPSELSSNSDILVEPIEETERAIVLDEPEIEEEVELSPFAELLRHAFLAQYAEDPLTEMELDAAVFAGLRTCVSEEMGFRSVSFGIRDGVPQFWMNTGPAVIANFEGPNFLIETADGVIDYTLPSEGQNGMITVETADFWSHVCRDISESLREHQGLTVNECDERYDEGDPSVSLELCDAIDDADDLRLSKQRADEFVQLSLGGEFAEWDRVDDLRFQFISESDTGEFQNHRVSAYPGGYQYHWDRLSPPIISNFRFPTFHRDFFFDGEQVLDVSETRLSGRFTL